MATTESSTKTSAAAPDPGSFASFLQERRAALSQKKKYTLTVPGFDGEDGQVKGVYRRPEYEDFKAIKQTLSKLDDDGHNDPDMYSNADLIIMCCERLYAVDANGNEGDLPGWNLELAEMFGIDTKYLKTDRQAVLAIFDGNLLLLAAHVTDLLNASKVGAQSLNEMLLGE